MSTQKQGEGVSLEAQKDAITVFASRQNLTVIRWFEEKETAAKSGRQVFNQMLKLLLRGSASGLIMHKIDRSARNLKDWAIISELPDAGIDVHIATESLDFRSRGGRLTADIQAVIAADFIRNLREETIKGLTGRLKQGLYPFRAPIGYLDNGRGQPKTICPKKGPLIRCALELYASGEHSIRSLQWEMQRRGLGNHAGKPLSKTGIETILKNPFYCGLIRIQRTGAIYQGIHEPLIDAKTFERVQDVKTGKAGKKVTRHDHTYRGLFRCGYCDGPMSPEIQKGRVYYRCQMPRCATKTIREDRLEEAIRAKLRNLQLSSEEARSLEAAWRSWMESDQRSALVKSLDMQIGRARERLDRLTDLLIDRAIGEKEFNTRKRTLMLELTRLTDERHDTIKNHLSPIQMAKFLELMKNLAELHIFSKPAEKRQMVRNAFSNCKVVGKSIELEPYDWLLEVQNAAAVSVGDPYRPTSRTLGIEKLANTISGHLNTFEVDNNVCEELGRNATLQWKCNLKNQRPDDLKPAA